MKQWLHKFAAKSIAAVVLDIPLEIIKDNSSATSYCVDKQDSVLEQSSSPSEVVPKSSMSYLCSV